MTSCSLVFVSLSSFPGTSTLMSFAKKVRRKIGLIHRNFYLAPEYLRHTLYRTPVCPILEYSCATCHPPYRTLTNRLESVQRFACRVILQSWNLEHDDLFSHTSLPTHKARRDCSTKVQAFKILVGLSSAPNVFIPHTCSDLRRNHSRALYTPFSRLKLCQRSFFHLVPKIWNKKLPENVASCVTLPAFKAAVKTIIYRLVVSCAILSVYLFWSRKFLFFFGFVTLFDCLGFPVI